MPVPIVVVIPTYNSRRWLRECLDSIAALDQAPTAVVVVDNGSSDGTLDTVRELWPWAETASLDGNPGYGAAINEGARRHPGLDVLALNVDTRIEPDALNWLARPPSERPGVGAVGPRLQNPDGSLQPSIYPFPTLSGFLRQSLLLDRIAGRQRRAVTPAGRHEVPWVAGAALLIAREAWDRVGGFDPSYRFYVEEIDLQRRLQVDGWRIVYEPAATVVHFGGHQPVPALLFCLSHDSYERYFGVHHGWAHQVLVRPLLIWIALTRLIGWSAIALRSGRRTEAGQWVAMFAGVVARSAVSIPQALFRRHEPFPGKPSEGRIQRGE